MSTRRRFMLGAAATVMAPYILKRTAQAATPLVRRDVMDMATGDRFFSDYAVAIRKMHELPESDPCSWMSHARVHADYCRHTTTHFLYWHRHYLSAFEKMCSTLSGNPDFALPYWNWSKNSGLIPSPFFDVPELNVDHWNDPGQYRGRSWPTPIDSVGRRGLDKTHGLLSDPLRGGPFTQANINAIKQQPGVDSFRQLLEGQPHNTGHVRTGATVSGKVGHMGDGLSPLDPIFWLHHCMVDRVWAEWQATGHVTPDPGGDYSGQFCNSNGSPSTGVTSATALDITKLGYTYDVLLSPPPGTLPPSSRLEVRQTNELDQLLKPQFIAGTPVADVSRPNSATEIRLQASPLKAHVEKVRELSARGLALGHRRVLARFTGVQPPERSDLIVNVFVNCPYLEPTTPYTDPHYAGSFSFFGSHSMPEMTDLTFVVDLTSAVQETGFDSSQINVQLMPLSASPEIETKSSFQVKKVEILTV